MEFWANATERARARRSPTRRGIAYNGRRSWTSPSTSKNCWRSSPTTGLSSYSSGDLFSNAVMANLDGVSLRVISLPNVIANKKAVARPRDLIDAEFLEKIQARAIQK